MKKIISIVAMILAVSQHLKSQSCQNCGIGTTNPQGKLEVRGCTNDSTTAALKITNSVDTTNAYPLLYVRNDKMIGINTKYPKNILEVQSAGTGGLNIVNLNASTKPSLGFYMNSTITSNFVMGVDGADASKFKIGTSSLTTNTRLTIDGSGNIGIGTTSPTYKLRISGGDVALDNNKAIYFENATPGTYKNVLWVDNTNHTNIDAFSSKNIRFRIGGTDLVRILDNGKVGIGTTTPNEMLEIYKSAQPSTRIGDGQDVSSFGSTFTEMSSVKFYHHYNTLIGAKIYAIKEYSTRSWGGTDLRFAVSNTSNNSIEDAMTINYLRRVGIGTVSPSAFLDINPTYTVTTSVKSMQSGIVYNGGSAMTNWYGNYIAAPTGTGTITNKYALVTEANAGKVGIGTTSPTSLLHLNGGGARIDNNNDGTGLRFDGTNAAGNKSGIFWFNNSGTEKWRIINDQDANNINDLRIYSNALGTNVMTLLQSGNVGIGTTTPSSILDIETTSSGSTGIDINNTASDGDPRVTFQLSGTSAFSIGVDDSDNDKLKIGTTAVETNTRLTIDGSGNVGIGTTSPNVIFDINGGIALRATTNAQITSDQNNYSIGSGTTFRLSSNSDQIDITGMAGGYDGKIVIVRNIGSFYITFKHENVSSTDTNRFFMSTGTDIAIAANHSVIFQYDATSTRWYDISLR